MINLYLNSNLTKLTQGQLYYFSRKDGTNIKTIHIYIPKQSYQTFSGIIFSRYSVSAFVSNGGLDSASKPQVNVLVGNENWTTDVVDNGDNWWHFTMRGGEWNGFSVIASRNSNYGIICNIT